MSTVQLITADLASVYSEGYICQRRSPASGHPIKSVQLLKETKQHGVSFPVPQEMGFSVASLSSRASSKEKKNQKKKKISDLTQTYIYFSPCGLLFVCARKDSLVNANIERYTEEPTLFSFVPVRL